MTGIVSLRPFQAGERTGDDGSIWDDWGVRDAPPPTDLNRMVVEEDGQVVGHVSWHSVWYGPNQGSRAVNIGISLVASARGRGVGTRAQHLLVEHVFATTDVMRVEASTDVQNLVEQRSLHKVGFHREGVLRMAQYRADGWHDLVGYSVLRTDPRPGPSQTSG